MREQPEEPAIPNSGSILSVMSPLQTISQTKENARRSSLIAKAQSKCAYCHGSGIDRGGRDCKCVDRAVFRTCLRRFTECVAGSRHCSQVMLERLSSGPRGYVCYGRKNEEYTADFCAIAKRTLTDQEYRLFKFHILLGADWKLCCPRLKMDRGNFFHALYRVEEKLGCAFRTVRPYALYPPADYFQGSVARARATPKLSAGYSASSQ